MISIKTALFTSALGLFALSPLAQADHDMGHFPALQADTIQTALCNMQSYQKNLAEITAKEELTTLDMVKVHELTYTLENALQRLQKDLVKVAADLEEVHQASEKLEADKIQSFGKKYLAQGELFTQGVTCPK
jgi:septal ring factor EnvC (AmiA/AmiB activator)